MLNKVLVIGAINIDILASSRKPLVKEDSNISDITFSLGGVGGNIATNLANCGVNTSMLTTLGDDYFSDLITKRYKDLKIDLNYTEIENNSSNIYLAVLDKQDLHLGLNDMSLTKHINKEFIQKHKDYINSFNYLVVDNNLPEEALIELTSIIKKQILIVDAVSITKAPKLEKILHRIDYLKLNKQELNTLTINQSTEEQIKELSNKGVKALIITDKNNDILLYKNNLLYKTPVIKVDNIISTSGCGDAFISGVTYGIINQADDYLSLEYGKQLASQTLQVLESTNEKVKIND